MLPTLYNLIESLLAGFGIWLHATVTNSPAGTVDGPAVKLGGNVAALTVTELLVAMASYVSFGKSLNSYVPEDKNIDVLNEQEPDGATTFELEVQLT